MKTQSPENPKHFWAKTDARTAFSVLRRWYHSRSTGDMRRSIGFSAPLIPDEMSNAADRVCPMRLIASATDETWPRKPALAPFASRRRSAVISGSAITSAARRIGFSAAPATVRWGANFNTVRWALERLANGRVNSRACAEMLLRNRFSEVILPRTARTISESVAVTGSHLCAVTHVDTSGAG